MNHTIDMFENFVKVNNLRPIDFYYMVESSNIPIGEWASYYVNRMDRTEEYRLELFRSINVKQLPSGSSVYMYDILEQCSLNCLLKGHKKSWKNSKGNINYQLTPYWGWLQTLRTKIMRTIMLILEDGRN